MTLGVKKSSAPPLELWTLSEDDDGEGRWDPRFPVLPKEEVLSGADGLDPSRALARPCIGRTRARLLSFVGDSVCFTVEVKPEKNAPERAALACVGACSSRTPSLVVCPTPAPHGDQRDLFAQALDFSARCGKDFLWSGVAKGRENVHMLPAAIEIVGNTLGLPLTPVFVKCAKIACHIENTIPYMLCAPKPTYLDKYCTVGSEQDARRTIVFWRACGKPPHVKVHAAYCCLCPLCLGLSFACQV